MKYNIVDSLNKRLEKDDFCWKKKQAEKTI